MGLELDKDIDVAMPRIEVVPENGPERLQGRYAVRAAYPGDGLTIVFDQGMYEKSLPWARKTPTETRHTYAQLIDC